mmetsp:Transcript_15084/g.25935  ORF Transcript_15084/g.25935 Transcript_15084/m.25935 type:complete len:188 (+) Transcript_15084:87-650(+)|eukprot:CAMPEP_0168586892 /NCGR_PEP_ID=MMETSP0420-20121227/4551_1 /TAXON_ID=498008 /ORGANISM="Pessonella sp." /LENGTH=187 /DNA_ID=CAMNT_0008622063 /DNA_START=53 /DNA_END=616 /DNA_ORIENTATION=+
MGIDISNRRRKSTVRKTTKSQNPYLRLLVKLYAFLSRRTSSKFNDTVYKRLCMTKLNRPTVSTSKLTKFMKTKSADQIAVVVGKIVNDSRSRTIATMAVAALGFSDTARARIEGAGGRCLTFDQLAIERPTGSNCVLLRGCKTHREANKHFGRAPGVPNSSTKPYVLSTGRKFERARGRRKSRGYKV